MNDINLKNMKLWKKIEAFFKLLAEGDSVDLARKKAGLSPQLHSRLLKDPDYESYVKQYRKKICGFSPLK